MESFEEDSRFGLGLHKENKDFECTEQLNESSEEHEKRSLSFNSSQRKQSNCEEDKDEDNEVRIIQSIIDDTSSHNDEIIKQKERSPLSSQSKISYTGFKAL